MKSLEGIYSQEGLTGRKRNYFAVIPISPIDKPAFLIKRRAQFRGASDPGDAHVPEFADLPVPGGPGFSSLGGILSSIYSAHRDCGSHLAWSSEQHGLS
jgi:hypothetical protein